MTQKKKIRTNKKSRKNKKPKENGMQASNSRSYKKKKRLKTRGHEIIINPFPSNLQWFHHTVAEENCNF
jgi:hypothetical protein